MIGLLRGPDRGSGRKRRRQQQRGTTNIDFLTWLYVETKCSNPSSPLVPRIKGASSAPATRKSALPERPKIEKVVRIIDLCATSVKRSLLPASAETFSDLGTRACKKERHALGHAFYSWIAGFSGYLMKRVFIGFSHCGAMSVATPPRPTFEPTTIIVPRYSKTGMRSPLWSTVCCGT
jgi:hypothetical protein